MVKHPRELQQRREESNKVARATPADRGDGIGDFHAISLIIRSCYWNLETSGMIILLFLDHIYSGRSADPHSLITLTGED